MEEKLNINELFRRLDDTITETIYDTMGISYKMIDFKGDYASETLEVRYLIDGKSYKVSFERE